MSTLEKKYPVVEVNLRKMRHNIDEMVKRCGEIGITVAGVVKVFNGIPELLRLYEGSGCAYIASSRLEHIETAREIGMTGPFMAIRIPMLSEASDLVRLADISLQSELAVIQAVEEECRKQGKTHDVILMADLGDLREGFWDKEEMLLAALAVEKEMEHVHLAGIGTNLGCYGSILATPEKMNELIDIAEKIEAAIGRKLEIISGGGSTSLPMVLDGSMPSRINHLRIGEGICLSSDLDELWGLDVSFMHKNAFTLKAEVVEVKDKPSYPVGEIFVDCFGSKGEYADRGIRRRAILALGKVDFAMDKLLKPRNKGVEIIGSSSDHLIIDIQDAQEEIKPGDILEFDLVYAPLVYLTNSRYVRIECK